MAENIVVTNEDVLRFYTDKFADEEHCPITAKYLSKLKAEESKEKKGKALKGGSLHGSYVETINTFKKVKTNEKDKEFYEWLQTTLILFFRPDDLDVFLEHTDYYDVALQKWHLYVSWYAHRQSGVGITGKKLDYEQLTESAKKSNGILQYRITCRELLLWMCEAAGSTQTEELYIELINDEEKGENRNGWLRSWAAKVRAEIERIIGEGKENKL